MNKAVVHLLDTVHMYKKKDSLRPLTTTFKKNKKDSEISPKKTLRSQEELSDSSSEDQDQGSQVILKITVEP